MNPLFLGAILVCFEGGGTYDQPLPEGARARLGNLRFRVGAKIDAAIPFPDGKRVVSLDGATVRLWDVETGREVASAKFRVPIRRPTPGPLVYRTAPLALSADGKMLAFLLQRAVLLCPADLIEPPTFVPFDFTLEKEGVVAVGFAGQQNVLVLLGDKGRVAIFRPKIDKRAKGFDTELRRGRFLAVGASHFAVADQEGKVLFFNLSGQQVGTLKVRCWDLGVAPGTDVIAIGKRGTKEEKKGVILWDMKQGRELGWIPATGNYNRLALNPQGDRVVCSGGVFSELELWSAKTGTKVHAEPTIGLRHEALTFFPDGRRLLLAGDTGVIRFFDGLTGQALDAADGAVAPVAALQFTPSGDLLVASHDGLIRQWDLKTAKEKRRFPGHRQAVTGLALDCKNSRFFSVGLDSDIRVYFLKERKDITRPATDQTSPWLSLALSPAGKILATGSGITAPRVVLWQADTGEFVRSLEAPKGIGIGALKFVDDRRLVARTRTGQILIWNIDGKIIHNMDGGAGKWAGVAVSPDGRYLASPLVPRIFKPNSPGLLGLWDLQTGNLDARLEIRDADLTAVAFTKDNKTLLVGDSKGRVHVWDLKNKKLQHTYSGHRGPVTSLAVAPDGKSFASGSVDTTVLLWDLSWNPRISP